MIDLRSDTVTKPTQEMREAAFSAHVGDDVYRDDPTVIELEKLAAHMLGMEDAMLVPSGTFGNQVSLLTHTNHGDEIIISKDAHLKEHEGGGAALISGVMMRSLDAVKGMMNVNEIRESVREDDIHYPKTKLIWLENAYSNGNVLSLDYLSEVRDVANEFGIMVHIDGARIFNAATFLNVDVKEITKYADSVQICLSKGLCAPIGSIVAGKQEFIDKARWYRKMMGGGMRQAGVIAAPGIIALKEMTKRLDVDHDNAKYLAEKLNENNFINVEIDRLDINMVFFTIDNQIISSEDLVLRLKENNILSNGIEKGEYRFVVSNDVSRDDIEYVIKIMNSIVK